MLDINADKMSYGYLDPYSAMSIYTSSENLNNNESFYAFPTPGYFPVNNMDTNLMWSVFYNLKTLIPYFLHFVY